MLRIPFGTFWRWSQLTLAIVIMGAEYMCRGVYGTILSFIPLHFLSKMFGFPPASAFAASTAEDLDLERSTAELVRARGYPCHEHYATTSDGYILGMQRIPSGRSAQDGADGMEDAPDAAAEAHPHTERQPAVLFLHGFMQCSEAWVCRKDTMHSLPLVLADAGYDVWLGNNRGNKYSHKHVRHASTSEEFWDWSLDEIIRYDVPAMIDYVLSCNGGAGLVLVGFSQGTAQSWAALSSNPDVASKVKFFVALAPVATVKGFSNPLIDSMARSRPDFITLLFGRRAFLPLAIFWRRVLPRDQLVALLDYCVYFLFGWTGHCLDHDEKKLLYSHIYSFSSVKAVVHWFQIIQTGRFQMFDAAMLESAGHAGASALYPSHVVPEYQPSHIQCPVALFYGGRDTLPNTPALLASLPKRLVVDAHEEPEYEHLDFMWAKDVGVKVYPRIVRLLEGARRKGMI